jgi:TonB-linked SusC/RagA family outer membrane protein
MLSKTACRGRACALVFLLFVSGGLFAQTVITGRVINNTDKQPVAGATIQVKGSKVATQSGTDGTFTLTSNKAVSAVVITVVGFNPETVDVSGRTVLGDIGLDITATSLNDVVVTGYTAQKKKDITGSVSVVNVENLKSVPAGTTESLLQGQASGVTVINSGVPGGGSTVRIRGITTIGSNDPLVLVDGTPGSLHDLDVNDIESIQVLKDAGAAAIYGVRGSNGVIIVTTKKGKPGKAKITYDGFVGTQRPLSGNVFNIANPQETGEAIWKSYTNDGLAPTHKQYGSGSSPVVPDYLTPTGVTGTTALTDPSTYALYSNQITKANKTGTDWFHEVFKPALIQSHTITASGGSDKSTYLFSFGYFDQKGTLIETYLKRYSARINTTFNIKDHIRVGENAYVFYKKNPGFTNQNEGNAVSYTYRESPIIPVYDIMGNYAGTNSKGLGNPENPVANMKRTHNNMGNDWQVSGNVFAEADLLKHITIRTQFGGNIDNYYYNSFSYTSYENAENNSNPNAFDENFGYNSSWTWTNTAKYVNTFAEDHAVSLVVGTEAIQSYGRAIQGRRGPYYLTDPASLTVDPSLWTLNFGPPAGQTTQNINGTPYQSAIYSLFGRLDYAFRDKYLISATLRRDGSSVFDKDHRFGYFPSVTAGWRISNESFMGNISWLNDLKIRGGWGKLGFIPSNLPSTNAFNLYSQSAANSYYDINGSSTSSVLGIYNNQLGNIETTWEQDITTNVGLDATILNNRLDLSIEWYNKSVSGLIFQPTAYTPNSGGGSPAYINSGDISNKGIDASVTYHANIGRDLKLNVNANLTSYKNQVKALPPGTKYLDRNSDGSSRIGAFTRLQPGQAVGAFFGYKVIGIFQDDAEAAKWNQPDAAKGRFKYADVNGRDANGNLTGTGDGKIDEADRTFFGNPNPDFTYGLTLSASYKNVLDLSVFFYGSQGADVMNYVRYWTDFPQVFDAAVSKDALYKSWSPENPGAKLAMLERSANFSNTTVLNSYYLENGSYLRCKSLMLGYTLPTSPLKQVGIDKLRIYVQAVNLFTITKYTGLDPELQGATLDDNSNFGIDLGNYPGNQKTYTVGVNLTF